jgi:hypothetical protein
VGKRSRGGKFRAVAVRQRSSHHRERDFVSVFGNRQRSSTYLCLIRECMDHSISRGVENATVRRAFRLREWVALPAVATIDQAAWLLILRGIVVSTSRFTSHISANISNIHCTEHSDNSDTSLLVHLPSSLLLFQHHYRRTLSIKMAVVIMMAPELKAQPHHPGDQPDFDD